MAADIRGSSLSPLLLTHCATPSRPAIRASTPMIQSHGNLIMDLSMENGDRGLRCFMVSTVELRCSANLHDLGKIVHAHTGAGMRMMKGPGICMRVDCCTTAPPEGQVGAGSKKCSNAGLQIRVMDVLHRLDKGITPPPPPPPPPSPG